MKCSKCGHECQDNAKFCEECGQPFASDEVQKNSNENNICKENTFTYVDNKLTSGNAASADESANKKENNFTYQDEKLAVVNNTSNLSNTKISKNKNKGCLRVFIIIAAIIFAIIIIVAISNTSNNDDSTSETISSTYNQKTTRETTTTETTTETTTKSAKELAKEKQEYIDSCEKISYKELDRYSDEYEGKRVQFTGEVIQAINSYSGAIAEYRIDVTKSEYGYYSDTIYVVYFPDEDSTKIIEDDIVTFYGIYSGLYTYESTMGKTVTVPKVNAEYIDIVEMSE